LKEVARREKMGEVADPNPAPILEVEVFVRSSWFWLLFQNISDEKHQQPAL